MVDAGEGVVYTWKVLMVASKAMKDVKGSELGANVDRVTKACWEHDPGCWAWGILSDAPHKGRGETKCQDAHKIAGNLTGKQDRDVLFRVVLKTDPGMFMAAISLLGNTDF